MKDNDYVVILKDPKISVNFKLITVGDVIRVIKEPNYMLVLMGKCILEDLNEISIDYLQTISDVFGIEYGRYLEEIRLTKAMYDSQ